MKNAYYRQTIELLSSKPDGMKLCNIARNIYNSNCGLFEDPDLYHKIYRQLKRYLWVQSRRERSPFRAVENRWGFYRLRRSFAFQFELPFDDFQYDIVQPRQKTTRTQNTQQLSLFN